MSARALSAALTIALAAALLAAGCAAPRPKPSPAPAPVPATPPPPTDVAAIPDAVPRAEPRSLRGNPPFYEVFGKRYAVLATAEGHIERGVASWYGPGFHAAQTSTGEPYDMYAMTAAHKTLPLPCYARVTNLANGRSVVVRVNDRGPFVAGRIVDLSYTAAAKLDMLRGGTAFVEMRVITPGTPAAVVPAPIAALSGGLYVQTGAFAESANARRQVERLRSAGIEGVFLLPAIGGDRTLHRVRIGPLGSVAEFDALSARLARLGITDARLASD
ncbi:MAG TPA: septal ring lytic transglycosylase RlpA family protein [Steroidobacteraceae bacterium]|nr:septal ring lytic transglycosylase RlpA family protein [Steroidobacteraceae bacterium]HQX78030.1 septal ring lytic transglycosylase RlpA family protein [Steroidobacteraceae bacterium]